MKQTMQVGDITLGDVNIIQTLDDVLVDKATRTKNDTIKRATGISKTSTLDGIRHADYNLERYRANLIIGRDSQVGLTPTSVRNGNDLNTTPELTIIRLLDDVGYRSVQKVEVLTGVLMTVLKGFVAEHK